MMRFLLALVTVLVATRTASSIELGTYYDALFHNSRALRLEDTPELAKGPGKFGRLASAFTVGDEPILDICKATGTRVTFESNAISEAQQAVLFTKYADIIDQYQVVDDGDLAPGGKAAVVAAVAAARARLPATIRTYIPFSKSAKASDWANVSEDVGLELYIHGEGTIYKWYWKYVGEWNAAHTRGKIYVLPYLGKRTPPFFGLYPRNAAGQLLAPDPVWSAEEYTPIQYNKVAIWAALCAGADDVLYYSAYSISPSVATFEYRIAKRWDLFPGYKALHEQIRLYERFFAGTKTTFDDGSRIVGATWTLPTGESLTVRVDTLESLPDVTFTIMKPLAAKVTQTEKGFNVEYTP